MRLADKIEELHTASSDKGYRRLNDDLRHDCGIYVNDKRVLRICRALDINYIHYYNTGRVQRNLGVLTPMEKHSLYSAA